MKRCPECRKDYLDDSLLYCLDDGTALVQGSISGEPATAILSGGSSLGEARTMALNARGTAEPETSYSSKIPSLLPRVRLLWIALTVLVAAMAGIIGWSIRRAPEAQSNRLVMNLVPPQGVTLSPVGTLGSVVELSPDGSSLLVRGDNYLWVRNFDSLDFYRVPGTDGVGNQPAWKDSQTIFFGTAEEELVSIRLPDGPPEVVPFSSRQGFSRGRSWSDKGTVLISMFDRLETLGKDGQPTIVQNPSNQGGKYFSPRFIPGTQDFIVLHRQRGDAAGEVWLATLSEGVMTNVSVLMKNATAARYTPAGGGHLLYAKNDNLYAQSMDLSARHLVGDPKLVAKGVASQPSGSISLADFSVSQNGVIAWRSGKAGTSQVTVFDRTGKKIGIAGPEGDVSTLIVSPKDESRVLVVGDGGFESFIGEVGQNEKVVIDANVSWSGWSNDGTMLYGQRDRTLVARPVDGGPEIVLGRISWNTPSIFMDLSPDRRSLLVTCGNIGPLCVSTLSDDGVFGEPVQITSSKDPHFDASFSPDGRSIVYSIRGSGVYVQPFPGPGRRVEIAANGEDPVWRRDGKEILYVERLSAVMSVSVSGMSGTLSLGAPQKLFDGLRRPLSSVVRSRSLGVSGDGSRIFWAQGVEQPEVGVINVMFGFFNDKQSK
jgi:WD40-like Beta Propeller Repeat